MIQDEQISLPNRRTTTAATTATSGDHAERVHSTLMSQAAARQAYDQQQQATVPTRRERMCLEERK